MEKMGVLWGNRRPQEKQKAECEMRRLRERGHRLSRQGLSRDAEDRTLDVTPPQGHQEPEPTPRHVTHTRKTNLSK